METKQETSLFPRSIVLELTNACTLRCWMCPRTTSMKRDVGMMDFDLLKSVVDEMSVENVAAVTLHGFGESLLYPKFFEAVKYIKDKCPATKIALSTNCTLLNDAVNIRLVDSGLNMLILSVDGSTKETYEKMRIGGDFEKVISSVKHLLLQKKDRPDSGLSISIQIIGTYETADEIQDFVDMWKPFLSENVYISVKKYGDFAGHVGEIDAHKALPDYNAMPCDVFWRQAVVLWDGTVSVCCADFDGDLSAGKMPENSLREIWNGDKLLMFRNGIASKTYEGLGFCKRCKGDTGKLLYQYPVNVSEVL